MAKKRSPGKPSPGPPRWRTRRVGSGITEKNVKWIAAEEFVMIPPEDWNARFVEASRKNEAVAWARGILEKAKLPTDPGRMHSRPGGGLCTLLDLVLLSRRKELEAPEWFAAKILTAWHGVETAKAGLLASQLPERARRWYESQLHRYTWEFAETATTAKMKFRWEPDVLSHQRARKGGKKGGSRSKTLKGVELYLVGLPGEDLKNPGKLWKRLKQYTPENPLIVRKHSLYRLAEDLCQDSGEKRIGFDAFRKYVYRARAKIVGR